MRPDLWREKEIDGIGGCYAVSVDVLVTPAEIDAELEAAEAEFDRQEDEKIERREAEAQAKAETAADLVSLGAYEWKSGASGTRECGSVDSGGPRINKKKTKK